uniref:Protein SPT2 homolog n=1 Tax=Ditylenchus dipsaci TaxID=166011 RepID=A0A915EUC0_9BILA
MDYSREQLKKKSGDTSRFTNFSETDEDEEEDEGPYEESDEYDSEMDDFIDDSIVDDLQREDFEESLKLINPRYDKKKWKMREMMIDDRKMDARYKDIETEEKLSAKIGLYEDIREARRAANKSDNALNHVHIPPSCSSPSFYIEQKSVVEGKIIESLSIPLLDECIRKCQRNPDCGGANFLLDLTDEPLCLLVDTQKPGMASATPMSDSIMYGIHQYCPHADGHNKTATYDSTQCSFLRVNQAGFTDLFDVILDGVEAKGVCEQKCLDSMRFNQHSRKHSAAICRSYVYDTDSQKCYLSHVSQRAFGRNVLENINPNLFSGDLDNCMQFKLSCKARSLILSGKSMKLFRGFVRSKRNKSILCERKINETNHFNVDIPFVHPSPTYSGLLMIKEGSTDMITVHDKMINVNCRLHQASDKPQSNRLLNVRFHVEQDNFTDATPLLSDEAHTRASTVPSLVFTTAAPLPKYRLEVVDKQGILADTVDVNDMGYLQITLEDQDQQEHRDAARYFSVSELVAENTGGKGKIELIDSAGCVSNPAIVKSLQRTSRNQMRIGILFGGFRDQAKVAYQALVKPCVYSCVPECNKQFFVGDKFPEESNLGP